MGRQSFRQSASSKPAKQGSDNTEHLNASENSRSLSQEAVVQAEPEGEHVQITPQMMAVLRDVQKNPTQQARETAREVAFINAQAQADYKRTYTPDSAQLRKRTRQDNRRSSDLVRRLAQRPGR